MASAEGDVKLKERSRDPPRRVQEPVDQESESVYNRFLGSTYAD
jgi:hypothetical protein